jgi:hypothetical protein
MKMAIVPSMTKLTIREKNKRNMTRLSRVIHNLEQDIVLAKYSGKDVAALKADLDKAPSGAAVPSPPDHPRPA